MRRVSSPPGRHGRSCRGGTRSRRCAAPPRSVPRAAAPRRAGAPRRPGGPRSPSPPPRPPPEDDRRPVEGDEAAQLADEGAERLVHLERRAEGRAQRFAASRGSARRPSSSRRCSASVARSRRAGLQRTWSHEPADDQGDHDHDPHLEGDVRPLEALVKILRAKRLVTDQHRHAGEGQRRGRPGCRSGTLPRSARGSAPAGSESRAGSAAARTKDETIRKSNVSAAKRSFASCSGRSRRRDRSRGGRRLRRGRDGQPGPELDAGRVPGTDRRRVWNAAKGTAPRRTQASQRSACTRWS